MLAGLDLTDEQLRERAERHTCVVCMDARVTSAALDPCGARSSRCAARQPCRHRVCVLRRACVLLRCVRRQAVSVRRVSHSGGEGPEDVQAVKASLDCVPALFGSPRSL
jgi:hypothetical protein